MIHHPRDVRWLHLLEERDPTEILQLMHGSLSREEPDTSLGGLLRQSRQLRSGLVASFVHPFLPRAC